MAGGLQLVLVQHLAAVGMPRGVVWVWLAVTGISLVMNWTLIPRLGPSGAALSTSIAYVLLAAGVVAVYRRAINARVLRDLIIGTR